MLEETLLPLAVEYGGRRWRQSRRGLRAQVRAGARGRGAAVSIQPLETVAGARLAAIATAHGHNVSAREARRRAMSGPLPSTAGALVQPGLFGRAGLRTEQEPAASALLDEAPIEDGAERRDRLAGPGGSRDLREPGVIAGMSGSLLSHDALDELWQRPDPAIVTFAAEKAHRHLRSWHAGIRARLGPTATARTIFDTVAEPLLRSLGFDISVVQSGSQTVGALLTTSARPVAALIAAPWVVPLRQPVAPGRAMRSGASGPLDYLRQRQRHCGLRRRAGLREAMGGVRDGGGAGRREESWCPVHAARRPRALRRRRSAR